MMRWWKYIGAGALLTVALFVGVGGHKVEERLFALNVVNGRVEWSISFADEMAIGDPVVAQDRVVIEQVVPQEEGQYQHNLLALDTQTGKRQWQHQLTSMQDQQFPELFLEPLADGSHLAVAAEYGALPEQWVDAAFRPDTADFWLQVIDTQSGEKQWAFDAMFLGNSLHHQVAWHVPTAGDSLFLISRETFDNVALQARSIDDGAVMWQRPLHRDGFQLFIDTNTYPYIFAEGETVYLNLGQQLHSFATADGRDYPAIPVEPGSGLTADEDALFMCRSGLTMWRDQQIVWQVESEPFASRDCQAVVGETAVYAMFDSAEAEPQYLLAIDKAGGSELWRTRVDEEDALSSDTLWLNDIVVTEGIVFVVGGDWWDAEVLAIEQENGRVVWRFNLDTGTPELATDGERLFVRTRSPRWRMWLASLNPAWH